MTIEEIINLLITHIDGKISAFVKEEDDVNFNNQLIGLLQLRSSLMGTVGSGEGGGETTTQQIITSINSSEKLDEIKTLLATIQGVTGSDIEGGDLPTLQLSSNEAYEKLFEISETLGRYFSAVAPSDTGDDGLHTFIGLFKRLLSVKLPNAVNNRIPTISNDGIKFITTIDLNAINNSEIFYTLDTSTRNSNCFLIQAEGTIYESILLIGSDYTPPNANRSILNRFSFLNFDVSDGFIDKDFYIASCPYRYLHLSQLPNIAHGTDAKIKIYEITSEFANGFYALSSDRTIRDILSLLGSIYQNRLPLLKNNSIPVIPYRPDIIETPVLRNSYSIGSNVTAVGGLLTRTKALITNTGQNPVYVDVAPGLTTSSYAFLINPKNTITDQNHTGIYYFRCEAGLTTNIEIREWQ